MSAGPHVFGANRRGLWIGESANLTDKLKHFLPRLRNAIPNLTDVFLPPSAGPTHKDQCRQANFFVHMYSPPPHGRTPQEYVDQTLARFKAQGSTGALELNIEGVPDEKLFDFVTDVVGLVRDKKPNLPLRINVVPFKGQWLPADLFLTDPQLYLVVQAYGGNMDALYAAEDVLANLEGWGLPRQKTHVMHAVMCSQEVGGPRQITLPQIRDRGAFYIDDLLLDAGLI